MKNYTRLFYISLFLVLTTSLAYQSCSEKDEETPKAAFTYTSDNDFHTPSTITFKNESTDAKEYVWDFGDGSATSSEMDPEHTYDSSGTYTVTLMAKRGALKDEETATFQITPFAPVAEFSFTSDNEFHAPSVVTFTNESSNASEYEWDFGDGSEPSAEKDPVHTYTQPGDYAVKLTAINETLSNEKTDTVTVTAFMPEADFTYTSNNDFIAPSKITFTNKSTHATRVSWDFGDDSPASTASNPVHEYKAPGSYTVSLTASNGDLTDKKEVTIEIEAMAYTGLYKLVSVVLSKDITVQGTLYPAGTDVTDVALGVFAVVTCSTPADAALDLRYNGDLYLVCPENSNETKGGTWDGNADTKVLNLNFSSPPYPDPFKVKIQNVTVSGSTLTGEMIDNALPGSVAGVPEISSLTVSCALTFEKI